MAAVFSAVGIFALLIGFVMILAGFPQANPIERYSQLYLGVSLAIGSLYFFGFSAVLTLLTRIAENTDGLKRIGQTQADIPKGQAPESAEYYPGDFETTALHNGYRFWKYADGHVEAEVGSSRFTFDSFDEFERYVRSL